MHRLVGIVQKMHLVPRYAIIVALSASMLGAVACQPPSAEARNKSAAPEAGLRSLQKAKYLNASLSGLVEMPFGGQADMLPLLLNTASVPIQWSGTIFDGKVQGAGGGGGTTIQVHGSVSDDGEWVETMSYSRQVASKGTGSIDYCQVELREVPITFPTASKAAQIGTFAKTGADVQKHVEKMLYTQGSGGAGTVPIAFDSLLWDNLAQPPVLKLAFEIVPSQDIGSGKAVFGH